jgi:hypothetical protein
MKQKTKLLNWMPSGILALILAGSTSTALAQLTIATFDTDLSEQNGGLGGSVAPTTAWASTGNPGGSEYVTVPWGNKTGWQDSQINFNVGGNASSYLLLECDIKVDIANSQITDSGDYGGMGLYFNGWNGDQGWTWVGGGTIANTAGWQHFSGSVAVYAGHFDQVVVGLNVNQYGTAPHAGTCHYWLDNVKLTAVPVYVPPPTMQNPQPAPKHTGLTLLPATQSQWQRVMVYPATALGTAFGWYNSAHFPVSYSFTIADFPNLPNYGAQVFWVPNVSMEWGVGDTSIDWNMTNGMVLSISGNNTNPPTGWGVSMAAKTNLSGANCNLTITNYSYGQLPVGTWTVTFNNNTDFTITAPDSSVVSASLTAGEADYISGHANGSTAMTPYIGIQNNNLIGIGHPAVFSNIRIHNIITNGIPGTLEDNFNTGSLDTTNLWAKLTDNQADITVNSGLAWYLAWNMPNDNGYGPLQAASSISGSWVDFSPANSWIVVNGTNRTATITTANLQSKLGGTDVGFFRLVKRVFTKLQVLLPGETAAPNTPTGKTGTPTPVSLGAGGNEDVTVNAVDSNWNIVNASDTITLTSSDGMAILPLDMGLVGGTVTFSGLNAVAFSTVGSQTITATDTTNPGITANTSSSVTVGP